MNPLLEMQMFNQQMFADGEPKRRKKPHGIGVTRAERQVQVVRAGGLFRARYAGRPDNYFGVSANDAVRKLESAAL